jgi:hypothetical protein
MSTQATEVPSLPCEDEITKAERLVMDADEAVREIAQQVFAVTNYHGKQEVTLAEIGRLFLFVRHVESDARFMLANVAKVDQATANDLRTIAVEGEVMSIPQFNEHGSPNYSPALT